MYASDSYGTPHAVRGAVGSFSVSLSPNGDYAATFTINSPVKWKNEFGKEYSASPVPVKMQIVFKYVRRYGKRLKVRVIYRLYNSTGTRVATSEYYTGYVPKVLSGNPFLTLTGISMVGDTTSANGKGEFVYNGACGTGSASYKNPFYADASSLTIRYLKQAASASYPDLNSMSGLSTGNTTVGSTEMIYIFVDVQLRPTFTATLQPAGSTVQYQGEAIIPGTDFVVNFSSNPTGLTLNDFNWNKNVTGKRQDIVWSYTGTSSGKRSSELPGTYAVTGTIADTQRAATGQIIPEKTALTYMQLPQTAKLR